MASSPREPQITVASWHDVALGTPERIRRLFAVLCLSFGIGGAIGALTSIGVRIVSGMSETNSLLFVGIPVGLISMWVMWRRLPRALGYLSNVSVS